jgi:hypothetical protein
MSYTYFDYNSEASQAPEKIFSSILRQIVASLEEIPESLLNAYNQRSTTGPPLNARELQSFILSIFATTNRTYIVIDALDECAADHRESILNFITELRKYLHARVLITSRQHLDDINRILKDDRKILIEASPEDLSKYISFKILNGKVKDKVDGLLAHKIVERLLAGAKGMQVSRTLAV